MQIDIISDTICPWCYIGEKQFDKALAIVKAERPDVAFETSWRPFQLSPDTPKDGVDRKASLERKFGSGRHAREIYKNIARAGAEVGIRFNFEAQDRTPNTLDSHRLIRWAGPQGCQDKVVAGLFKGYFIEGRDIGNIQVLSEIASENGMDAQIVQDLLKSDADIDQVKSDAAQAQELGITGVPAFVFNKKFIVGGAQDIDTFVRLLQKVISKMEDA
jgi:predicted DsbA family dithiol-disulfide isomerase